MPRGESFKGEKGDVALGMKWSPPALDGDAIGLWVAQASTTRRRPGRTRWKCWRDGSRLGRAVYAKDIDLVGLTYNTGLGGLGHRHRAELPTNMPLNVRSGFAYGTFPGLVTDPGMEGPRGDTIHFLASTVLTLNKNPLFDSGAIALQFDAMRLQKVTHAAPACTTARAATRPASTSWCCATAPPATRPASA